MPEIRTAVFLDYATVGPDIDMSALESLVALEYYDWTPPEEISQRIADAEIVITNKTKIGSDALAAASKLKLIVVFATGTDNVDTAAARDAGIAVMNIRDYCNTAVVQHVFALILSLTQQTRRYDALVKTGAWERSKTFALFDFPIRELNGRNLGIVGYGSLGRSVGDLGRSLGMKILVSARPGTQSPGAGAGAGRMNFESVLEQADVLTLHCPLTDATRSLLNKQAFARMRSDAIVINTARGGLIDSAALVSALKNGQIAGAGIDVLSEEPPRSGDPLLNSHLPNLIVTPHIAWASREARQRAVEQVVENIENFYSGRDLRRVV